MSQIFAWMERRGWHNWRKGCAASLVAMTLAACGGSGDDSGGSGHRAGGAGSVDGASSASRGGNAGGAGIPGNAGNAGNTRSAAAQPDAGGASAPAAVKPALHCAP